jgi:hypothetical protein
MVKSKKSRLAGNDRMGIKYMEVKLVPKEGQGKKEVSIAFPPVTMTVQEFCDFFNRIDEVVDFWHSDNFKPEDKELHAVIKKFLDAIDFPEGLPEKYPTLFDCKAISVNL